VSLLWRLSLRGWVGKVQLPDQQPPARSPDTPDVVWFYPNEQTAEGLGRYVLAEEPNGIATVETPLRDLRFFIDDDVMALGRIAGGPFYSLGARSSPASRSPTCRSGSSRTW
jgi:hypothetical protein